MKEALQHAAPEKQDAADLLSYIDDLQRLTMAREDHVVRNIHAQIENLILCGSRSPDLYAVLSDFELEITKAEREGNAYKKSVIQELIDSLRDALSLFIDQIPFNALERKQQVIGSQVQLDTPIDFSHIHADESHGNGGESKHSKQKRERKKDKKERNHILRKVSNLEKRLFCERFTVSDYIRHFEHGFQAILGHLASTNKLIGGSLITFEFPDEHHANVVLERVSVEPRYEKEYMQDLIEFLVKTESPPSSITTHEFLTQGNAMLQVLPQIGFEGRSLGDQRRGEKTYEVIQFSRKI